jgi:hypothetical protein
LKAKVSSAKGSKAKLSRSKAKASLGKHKQKKNSKYLQQGEKITKCNINKKNDSVELFQKIIQLTLAIWILDN